MEGTGATPSFEKDIKPLFRDRDRGSMLSMFDLWSYDNVNHNADPILQALENGTMPCDGASPQDQVETFRRWVHAGKSP